MTAPLELGGREAGRVSLLGRMLCAIGQHPCMTNSDDNGVWGECIRCRRRFGYVDRATLRRYIDREVEAEMARKANP